MEELIRKSNWLVNQTSTEFVRYIYNDIDWSWRFVGITGARGVGKTTLLLQKLKLSFGLSSSAIYITLDDFYFTNKRLYDFVEQFRAYGGRHIFIDEVHKYKGWARELKNIYDTYSDLFIAFTGSSVIDILKEKVDLSRRAVMYRLNGLSFREYLIVKDVFKTATLDHHTILTNHQEIANEYATQIKPLIHFAEYLQKGYYPFFKENINVYYQRIEQILNLILESDLSFIEGFNPKNIQKIKQLLYIIAQNVPFTPNITQLSGKIGIHRNTLVEYLHYLEKAEVVKLLFSAGKSVSTLQKPDKIYLNNTNIAHAIAPEKTNTGTQRETFIINQLAVKHKVNLPKKGDFIIDDKYTIEVGGKGKNFSQIAGIDKSYIAIDGVETGAMNKIPLWLFGFLY